MPRKIKRALAFNRGLFTSPHEAGIPEGGLSEATNVRYDFVTGEILKRPGYYKAHASSPSGNIVGLIHFPHRDVAREAVLIVVRANGSIDEFDSSVVTNLAGAGSLTTPTGAAMLGDVLYIADGGALNSVSAASPGVFTGNIAGTPAAVYSLATYNLRLFGTNGNTLYYSALNDGATLGNAGSGGGSINLDKPITAIATVGQSLFILHRDSISRFTGWSIDDFQVDDGARGVTAEYGLSSFQPQLHAVCVRNEPVPHVLFVTALGVSSSNDTRFALVSVTEAGEVTRLSTAVDQSWTGSWGTTSGRVYYNPVQEEVWVDFGSLWVYNVRMNAWTQWTGSHPNQLVLSARRGGQMFGAISTSPNVWAVNDPISQQNAEDSAHANGSNFAAEITIPFPLDEGQFSGRFAHLVYSNPDATLTIGLLSGTQTTIPVTTSDALFRVSVPLGGKEGTPRLLITETAADVKPWRIAKMQVEGFFYDGRHTLTPQNVQ